MARSHLANRVDGNHKEIVKHFESFGCSVLSIADLANCCDIIVSKHGRSIFTEIKNGKNPPSARKLTSGEIKFKAETKGIWRLVESIADADKVISELNSTLTIPMRWDGKY